MSNSLPITVLGAGGWIGSALVASLRRLNHPVFPVFRSELRSWIAGSEPIGPVIYAIGLTSDFRQRPYETVEAHVSLLSKVLQRYGLENLLLLSSTRVYGRSSITDETAPLPCLSSDSSDLYNLSKLTGEALVLQDSRPDFRVVRLSNVVGEAQPVNTFIGSLLAETQEKGGVVIREPAGTLKDYVALADVVRLLPLIALKGKQRMYNLGSGVNTRHADVAAWLRQQGALVRFATEEAATLSFPPLRVQRIIAEFDPPGDPFRQTLLEL